MRSFEHTPGGTVQFAHGDDHGLGTMTVAISNSPPGGGATEHRHPCGEVFVVYWGVVSTPSAALKSWPNQAI